jgi:AcrR family transcriptional regulator
MPSAPSDPIRHRILEIARASFLDRGYAATTFERVAQAADLAPEELSAIFVDKQSLAAASFYAELTACVENGFASLPPTGVVEQLCSLAEHLYEWHGAHPEIGRALIQANFLAPDSNDSDVGKQLDVFVEAISKLLEDAKSRGELAPNVDVWLASQGFFFDYLGVLIGALTGRVEFGPPQVDVLAGLTRMRLGLADGVS